MATIADPRDIIVAPVVSEKSYGLMEQGVYTFLVHTDANKTQIKIAVQEIFGAKVASVNTLNREGKRKRSRTGYGKRKNTKRAYVTLAAGGKEGKYAVLRMPSSEIRRVDARCRATVGEVGNQDQINIRWGKAGRMRWKGWRPTVRGVVMNPVDHPHGGGEGKTSGGRHPVSPWGQKEGRTRKPNRPSDQLIVRRRRTNKNKKR